MQTLYDRGIPYELSRHWADFETRSKISGYRLHTELRIFLEFLLDVEQLSLSSIFVLLVLLDFLFVIVSIMKKETLVSGFMWN